MKVIAKDSVETQILAFSSGKFESVVKVVNNLSKSVAKQRNLIGLESQPLILRLPPFEKGLEALNRFFDAPFKVAGNQIYRGVFAIDVSECANAYRKGPDYENAAKRYLCSLYEYMLENPDCVYCILLSCSSTSQLKDFLESNMEYKAFSVKKYGIEEKTEAMARRHGIGY